MSAATAPATQALAERFIGKGLSNDAYRCLGRSGLSVSALGFGGYRVDDQTPAHREALEMAVREGCNLIDTSTNYTDGGSESCIGETIDALVRTGRLAREEIVVVSKIGYVQGRNLDHARRLEQQGDPFPEMVKISDGCWHCIHPRFLEDQLTRSLSRLRLERLDVCLLHNPEYFLQGQDPEASRALFYERIRKAFVFFEKEVQKGRIAWYGVSSNSFGAGPEDPESTSMGRMLEAARQAARDAGLDPEDHHFAAAQLPLNLFEHGPVTVKKEGAGGGSSTVGFAAENGIGILVNRPLNAFARGELIRLADFRFDPPEVPIPEALKRVSALEDEFLKQIGRHLQAGRGGTPVEGFFDWGRRLAGAAGRLGGYEHWQAVQEQQIHPRLLQTVSALREALPPEISRTFREWLDRYLEELGKLLAALRAECAGRSQQRSDRFASLLDPRLPPEIRPHTLSRKALHVAASVEGVTCVLNGMRHPHYVEDSTGVLRWKRISDAQALLGLL